MVLSLDITTEQEEKALATIEKRKKTETILKKWIKKALNLLLNSAVSVS